MSNEIIKNTNSLLSSLAKIRIYWRFWITFAVNLDIIMNNYRYIRSFLLILILSVTSLTGVCQLNTERLLTIGRNALYFEDYLLSIQYFNQVIKVKPYLADPYFFRGLAKFYLEDYSGAEADCTMAIDRNPFVVDAYEVRALSRLQTGKYLDAVKDYDKGLEFLPENKVFMLNKAIALQNAGEFGDSHAAYDELLQKFPKYDKGYLGRAQLCLAEKDSLAALPDLDKCLELNANTIEAYLMRADIHYGKSKDYEAAVKDLDAAVKLSPKEAGLFINRAYLKYNLEDYFGAMADFDYAIGLDPENVTARFNRGLLRMEVQDVNKAIEDFTAVISMEPDNDKAVYNRAVLYQQLRQYRKAIADYDKVIGKYPYLSALYFARGECKRMMGDMKGGERDYNKSREMQRRHEERRHIVAEPDDKRKDDYAEENPEDVMKRLTSLETVDEKHDVKPEYDNKYRGKIQNYDIPVRVEDSYVLSYYDRTTELRTDAFYQKELDELNSSLYLRDRLFMTNAEHKLIEQEIEKQFELIRHYTALLNNGDKRAVDYFGRAISYMMVKNYDSAIQDLSEAVKLSPRFALAYFVKACAREAQERSRRVSSEKSTRDDMMAENARYAEIVADYDKAVELSPRLIYAYFNKGNLFYMRDDYTSAISCYTKAIEIKQDFGEAYYNRGIAFFRMGNFDKGMADLSRAGELGIMSSYNLIKRMRRNSK